ncbi:MAG: chlorophyll synthase ChlG [Vulcanimicrobiaceae bacterium]
MKAEPKGTVLRDSARSTVETVGHFGAMMLPFANRQTGAARINASLRMFAKPGTWFAPMWAMLVGCVASGNAHWDFSSIGKMLLGMLLAGPLLCAFSQVVNDWFDREVDRINEPDRPTAANALAPLTVLLVAVALAAASLGLAAYLGTLATLHSLSVFWLSLGGLLLALAYSAPPLRLKARNGWLANAACAFAYEGFAWIAGAAIFGKVTQGTLVLASLYSLGSHGLMTLNDFKSYEGDKRLGLRSLPVMLGLPGALRAAFAFIDVFQVLAIGYVLLHAMYLAAGVMLLLFVIQLPMQRKLAHDPAGMAPWYCASAIPPFVWGMLVSALALRSGGF